MIKHNKNYLILKKIKKINKFSNLFQTNLISNKKIYSSIILLK